MPETVIDHFETVKVDEHDRKQVIGIPLGAFQAVLQSIQKEDAIWQSGQCIMDGIVSQLVFSQFAGSNVRLRSRYAIGGAFCIPYCQPATERPQISTVGMLDPILTFKMRG